MWVVAIDASIPKENQRRLSREPSRNAVLVAMSALLARTGRYRKMSGVLSWASFTLELRYWLLAKLPGLRKLALVGPLWAPPHPNGHGF